MSIIKPKRLKKGDQVAIVSLSWGGAGDEGIYERYKIGKQRLEDIFGLEVIEMPHALKGSAFVDQHPEKRAEDLMNAFKNPNIKAIISTIGGDDTLRLLPYIDFEVIQNNPKIFMGYSDTTVNHMMCYKAGLVSFYGPSVLSEFAENVSMHEYTVDYIQKTLFSSEPIGNIESSPQWTSEHLEWSEPKNNEIQRTMQKEKYGYELLQGDGKVSGELIGGCIEVFDWLRGTELWPEPNAFKDAILFFETSEDQPTPDQLRYYLRALNALGVFEQLNGLIIGKPQNEQYYEAYKEEYIKVIKEEAGRDDLVILYNLNFGHTAPQFILPYGVKAIIDCERKSFKIIESGVK